MFGFRNADQSGADIPPDADLRCLLAVLHDQLQATDSEHGDVAVTDYDSGWTVSAHRDGRAVFENLRGEPGARHMHPVSRERMLELWERFVVAGPRWVVKLGGLATFDRLSSCA